MGTKDSICGHVVDCLIDQISEGMEDIFAHLLGRFLLIYAADS
jgi:hypothetical protein